MKLGLLVTLKVGLNPLKIVDNGNATLMDGFVVALKRQIIPPRSSRYSEEGYLLFQSVAVL